MICEKLKSAYIKRKDIHLVVLKTPPPILENDEKLDYLKLV